MRSTACRFRSEPAREHGRNRARHPLALLDGPPVGVPLSAARHQEPAHRYVEIRNLDPHRLVRPAPGLGENLDQQAKRRVVLIRSGDERPDDLVAQHGVARLCRIGQRLQVFLPGRPVGDALVALAASVSAARKALRVRLTLARESPCATRPSRQSRSSRADSKLTGFASIAAERCTLTRRALPGSPPCATRCFR
jgi:hypothetical protein